ncbi:MAG: cell division protein FtsL [Cardiobacteriaceae bacterium]|nr:cell division protein FtsL [Cardiobacteriaceae bacterium]
MKILMLIVLALTGFLGIQGVRTVVYAHEHANLVSEVQMLKQSRDKINAEWTQLLLEQKMLADDSVINRAVAHGLEMHLPQATQVVYLH